MFVVPKVHRDSYLFSRSNVFLSLLNLRFSLKSPEMEFKEFETGLNLETFDKILSGNFLLKLGITFGFITQSKLLGGSTPQNPERISF